MTAPLPPAPLLPWTALIDGAADRADARLVTVTGWPVAATEAGATDRLWEIGDIVALLEEADAKSDKRGPCRKSALDQVSS
ncbi:hypothetical protein [uncultured Methylobacterium sp.]|uniref:hypothetical protein n=1 Tax=uncultured Methylobacterium sp. TaxID=157278 RepID=UPI002586BC08|nr:hypothetical protein [uncultured Methylobacterium sp.]